jgi:hypothetical protein
MSNWRYEIADHFRAGDELLVYMQELARSEDRKSGWAENLLASMEHRGVIKRVIRDDR